MIIKRLLYICIVLVPGLSLSYGPDFNRIQTKEYVYNNLLAYTDPTGEFAIIDSWLIGYVHGFYSTGSHRGKAAWKEANLRAGNDLQIWGGLFVTDPNKKGGGRRIGELASRFSWQILQTTGGFGTVQCYNTFGIHGGVATVDYKYGVTILSTRSADEWGAVTQGSFIVSDKSIAPDETNITFQHEYGHYIQSQGMGFAYYGRVAIPSIGSQHGEYKKNYPSHDFHPVELDANRRAFLYFNKNVSGYDWKTWSYIWNPLDVNHLGKREGAYIDTSDPAQMSQLDNLKVTVKWYDYIPPFLISGFFNSYNYNH